MHASMVLAVSCAASPDADPATVMAPDCLLLLPQASVTVSVTVYVPLVL